MKVKHLLQIDLIIPAFLPEIFNEDHNFNALKTLLSFSEKRVVSEDAWQGWLANRFSLNSANEVSQYNGSIAALAALGEGITVGDAYWMYADPVYMHLQRDCVVMQGGLSKNIDEAESQAILASLNEHFGTLGLVFVHHKVRGGWYICLNSSPKLTTTPLFDAMGIDVHRFMPSGDAGALWRSYLNECQMLLHEHPVNMNREQAGKRPVNSLWFWGGGCLPNQVRSEFTKVMSTSSFAKGLAILQGLPVQETPSSAQALLEDTPQSARLLVVQDAIEQSLIYFPETLSETLSLLEQHWFAPLLQGLKKGRIDILNLHFANTKRVMSFELKSSNLWKHRWQFWHRPQPLKKWLA